MATVNAAGSETTGISERAMNGFLRERQIDMSVFTPGATDIVQLMNIPLGFIVTGGELECDTPGTTNTNGQIGITGDDANGFLTVQDLDGLSAGDIVPFDGAYLAALTGRHFPAADTIDMLYDTAADAVGVYTLRVWGNQSGSNVIVATA